MTPPQNVSEAVYRRAVAKRIGYCRKLAAASQGMSPIIRLVVLSCKRTGAFARLMESLDGFREQEQLSVSTLLVDNGSGRRLLEIAQDSKFFDNKILHDRNIGMGAAINDALIQYPAEFVLFVEDDLILEKPNFLLPCVQIFREFQEVGIVKLKRKADWDTMYPYRRIGPMQTTSTGVRFHPWLPSTRWSFRWGQRPWYPAGIHNCWSLGPVMFRWCSWKENGPIPSGRGRGQALAAEEVYARTWNTKWIAAKPVDFAPFSQPVTAESPGFRDCIRLHDTSAA